MIGGLTSETSPHAGSVPHPSAPLVRLIDPHRASRAIVETMLETVGHASIGYTSADAFLTKDHFQTPGCLVMETRLPDRTGLSLQADLVSRKIRLPIIFLTSYGDIPMSVQAMRRGAIDFLTKPLRPHDLLDALDRALDVDRANRAMRAEHDTAVDLLSQLTRREMQIVRLACTGITNRAIGDQLGVSEITVKMHRGAAMKKLGAPPITTIARMLEALDH